MPPHSVNIARLMNSVWQINIKSLKILWRFGQILLSSIFVKTPPPPHPPHPPKVTDEIQ